jgi:integrase
MDTCIVEDEMKLTKRGDVWHVVGTLVSGDGSQVRIRRSTGTGDRAVARQIMQEMVKGGGSRPSSLTLGEVLGFYEGKGLGRNDASVARRLRASFGGVEVARLDVPGLHAWARQRGIAAETFRRELATLGAALNYARRAGMAVPVVDLLKPPPGDGRARWLTPEEQRRLLEVCGPDLRGLVSFLLFTGARPGEARGLLWRDVGEDHVVLATRKRRHGRLARRRVPLSPLVELPERGADGDRVFGERGYDWWRDRWLKACARAGLVDLVMYDLRHTFASTLLQAGANVKAVAELLGHTTTELLERYGHLVRGNLEAAIDTLATHVGQAGQRGSEKSPKSQGLRGATGRARNLPEGNGQNFRG